METLETKVEEKPRLSKAKKMGAMAKQGLISALCGFGTGLDPVGLLAQLFLSPYDVPFYEDGRDGPKTIAGEYLCAAAESSEKRLNKIEDEHGKMEWKDLAKYRSCVYWSYMSGITAVWGSAILSPELFFTKAPPIFAATGMISAAYGAYKNGKKALAERKKKNYIETS